MYIFHGDNISGHEQEIKNIFFSVLISYAASNIQYIILLLIFSDLYIFEGE